MPYGNAAKRAEEEARRRGGASAVAPPVVSPLEYNHVYTRAEFRRLSPRDKGFVVYMLGARKEQPNVPESYTPGKRYMREYLKGQRTAVQVAQDSEE